MSSNHYSYKNTPIRSQRMVQSFKFALRGIKLVFQSEKNFRTHVLLAVLAVVLGIVHSLSIIKWLILILCIVFMFAVETLNTSIEYLVDWIADGQINESAARVKDLSAAACLFTASGLLLIGILMFIL